MDPPFYHLDDIDSIISDKQFLEAFFIWARISVLQKGWRTGSRVLMNMSSINKGSIDIDLDYCWAAAGVFLEVGGVGVEVKAFYVTIESPVLVRKRK